MKTGTGIPMSAATAVDGPGNAELHETEPLRRMSKRGEKKRDEL